MFGHGAVLGELAWWVMHRALVDDAYITLSYAKNVALLGQWAATPGVPANTATSPLQVLLLAAVTFVVRDAVVATGILTAILLGATALALRRVGRGLEAPALPWVGTALLATSPLLVSTIGLESYAAAALIALGGAALVARNGWWVGAVAGLLVLCRPDLGVVALVLVGLAGRGWWRAGIAAVAVYLPWLVFSWYQLGSVIPDTWLLKYGGSGFELGLLSLYGHLPAAIGLSVLPAAVGVLAFPWLARHRVAWWWLLAGLGHFVTMWLLGNWIYHWYYGPTLAGCSLVAALAVSVTLRGARPARFGVATVVAALLVANVGLLVGHGVVRYRSPVAINWASEAQYEALAATLPRGANVLGPGELGTLAYYCDCRILDGLSDRGYFPPVLDKWLPTFPPAVQTVLRWNYTHLQRVPPVRAQWRITSGLDTPGPVGPGFRLDGSGPNPSNKANPTDSRRVFLEPVPN